MRIAILICLLIPTILLGQNRKKAERAYAKAVDFYQQSFDKKAKDLAEQAIRQDTNFTKPYLLLGQLSENEQKTEEAIAFYLKGLADNDPKNIWGYWKVGMLEFQQGNYSEAQAHLQYFLSFDSQSEKHIKSANRLLANCVFALESLQNPVPFKPENMGEEINSKWEEYLPSISADGSYFVFTRRGPHQENIVSEDFFASTLKEGEWSVSETLGQTLNTFGNEGAQCLSSDGKILFFTACDREDGFGRCDIYVSFLGAKGWSLAQNIGPSVNSPNWESQPSISPDGKELYFVSNRPGGQGKMDIWYKPRTVPLLCNVCILNRAGEHIGIPSALAEMNEIVDGALLDNLPSGNLIRLQTPDLFVSSTLVRSLIARGAKQLPVPPDVADYIVKHDLYQDPE